MLRVLKALLAMIMLLSIYGCGSSDGGGGYNPPPPAGPTAGTFQYVQQLVLPKCIACHGAGSATGIDYSSYATLMASNVVTAGNPAASRFWTAINTGVMPKGGAKLSQVMIDAVALWIQNGALNN